MSDLAVTLTLRELRELVRGMIRDELARGRRARKVAAPSGAKPRDSVVDAVRRKLRRQGVAA